MVAQISAVGHADLAVANLPLAVKDNIGTLLSSGLSGGVSPNIPSGTSPIALGTIHSVITDSIAQGVRWAAFTAGVFVSFGALSSLLIPNQRVVVTQETKVPALATSRRANAAQIALLAQFALIEVLLFGLSSEYSANLFAQDWFSQNAWPIGELLANYVAPLLGLIVGLGGFAASRLLRRRNRAAKAVEEAIAVSTVA